MSSTIRIRALAAIFAVTTGALLFAGGPTQAAPTSDKGAGDDVCWINADIDTDSVQCFADEAAFADAVFEQTGTVLVEEGSDLASRGGVGILTTYVLARLYENASYGGSSTTVTSTNSAICSAGAGVLGNFSAGWNDRISSFHSYFSCSTRIYLNVGQGGTWFGYSIDAPGVGALDNVSSSYKLI
jgi:hypothetical protein